MDYNMPFFEEIMQDPQNAIYTAKGWHPIYSINPQAKILIVGQAPGKKSPRYGNYVERPKW